MRKTHCILLFGFICLENYSSRCRIHLFGKLQFQVLHMIKKIELIRVTARFHPYELF